MPKTWKPAAGQLLVIKLTVEEYDREAFKRSGVKIHKPDERRELDQKFTQYADVISVGDPILQYGEWIHSPVRIGERVVLGNIGRVDLPLENPVTGEVIEATIVSWQSVLTMLRDLDDEGPKSHEECVAPIREVFIAKEAG